MHFINDCALWISLRRTFSYFCSFSLFCYLLIFAYSEDQSTFLSNMSRPPVMQHYSWRIIIIWCTTQNIYDWIGFQIHALGFSKAYGYSKRFQTYRYVLVFWLLSDNHKKSLHYFNYFIKPSKQERIFHPWIMWNLFFHIQDITTYSCVPSLKALRKWGNFESAKNALKMLPTSCTANVHW